MMDNSSILCLAGLALYGATAVAHVWDIRGRTPAVERTALIGMTGAFAALTGGIVLTGIETGHVPVVNLSQTLTFLAWSLTLIYLIAQRRRPVAALGLFVCVLAFAAALAGWVLPGGVTSVLVPALRNRWSTVHIVSCMLGYASLALAFGAALGYMLQERMLKGKRISLLQRYLPPLDVMDGLAYSLVAFGFPMLTLGIITGALWALPAWGSYWHWDPKETWSLITWLIYAAYLHVRAVQGWRGKWSNRLLVTGFACILITYFGVNFLSQGLHRYNW